MIDLHCHLLPGIDDGPVTLSEALALARMAAGQGITTIACTPHILPGVYDNEGPAIRAATDRMQAALDEAGIPLRLVAGADLHIAPDNVARLRSGAALALAGSRYVLIELPHTLLPPRMDHALFDILSAGYVPILTHPERTGWIDQDYAFVHRLARSGVVMQITAGAFTGAFGRRARYWAERMLDEGIVDLVASDAHDPVRRPPLLAEAREAIRLRAGADRAQRIFESVPEAILADRILPEAPASDEPVRPAGMVGLIVRAFGLLTRSPRETRHAGHH